LFKWGICNKNVIIIKTTRTCFNRGDGGCSREAAATEGGKVIALDTSALVRLLVADDAEQAAMVPHLVLFAEKKPLHFFKLMPKIRPE
jgi:hypothetical protein